MVAAACVLYISMGLHEAVVKVLGIDLRITGCPKCFTFWAVLARCAFGGYGLLPSVFAAFSLAYLALWATLLLDALAVLYNKLYDAINKTTDTAHSEADGDATAQDATVSKM